MLDSIFLTVSQWMTGTIVIAGSSTAAVKKLLENGKWNGAGIWFRKLAGITIAILGEHFIVTPFLN